MFSPMLHPCKKAFCTGSMTSSMWGASRAPSRRQEAVVALYGVTTPGAPIERVTILRNAAETRRTGPNRW